MSTVHLQKNKKKAPPSSRGSSRTPLQRDKRLYEQVLKADADDVDLESLIEIVNGINDMMIDNSNSNSNNNNNNNNKNNNKKNSRSSKETLTNTCIDAAVQKYTENSFRPVSEYSPRKPGAQDSLLRSRSARPLGTGGTWFDPEPVFFPRGRKNMSFSNENVRQIDRDNRTLLRRILSQKPHPEVRPLNDTYLRRTSSAAINRTNRQREIDKENLRFLKKLQSVKPTKESSRAFLFQQHDRNTWKSASRCNIRSRLGGGGGGGVSGVGVGSRGLSAGRVSRNDRAISASALVRAMSASSAAAYGKKPKRTSSAAVGDNQSKDRTDPNEQLVDDKIIGPNGKGKRVDVKNEAETPRTTGSAGYSMNEFDDVDDDVNSDGKRNDSDSDDVKDDVVDGKSSRRSSSASSVASEASSASSVSSKTSSVSAKSVASKASSKSTHSAQSVASRTSTKSNQSSKSDQSKKSDRSSVSNNHTRVPSSRSGRLSTLSDRSGRSSALSDKSGRSSALSDKSGRLSALSDKSGRSSVLSRQSHVSSGLDSNFYT